jgi:hypothetical protein
MAGKHGAELEAAGAKKSRARRKASSAAGMEITSGAVCDAEVGVSVEASDGSVAAENKQTNRRGRSSRASEGKKPAAERATEAGKRRVAKILMDKSMDGDAISTKVMLSLTAKPKERKEKKKKKRLPGNLLAQRWAHQRAWRGESTNETVKTGGGCLVPEV